MMLDTEITPEMVRKYQKMVREQPITYANRVLGIDLWRRQQEIMRAFADPNINYISVRSGNGVGKTFMLASLVCQYLDTHAPGYAVISGSSWTGVLKTIWPSLRSLLASSPARLGGEVYGTEWRRGNMWGAFCVSPDKPENISGMRTKNGALVLIDEASALTQEVHEAIMGLCSAAGSKIVYSGNPIRAEGPFYDTFSDSSWCNFQISSEEAADQGIPGLATWEWIEGLKRQWGEDDPRYKARVLGEFPENIFDALVKQTWLKGVTVPRVMAQKGHLRLGVDVAGRGDDKTVLIVRDDRSVLYAEEHPETTMTEVVGITKRVMSKFDIKPKNAFMDATGLGNGPVDMLWEDGIELKGENFSSSAQDKDTFLNRRAELFWAVRDGFRPDSNETKQYVPKEYAKILDECTKLKHKPSRTGKIQIESKDDIRKRLGKSPDYADAYALTFAGDIGGLQISLC